MTQPKTSTTATSNNSQPPATHEQIRFADSYQTSVNAGTYTITATLNAPDALKNAGLDQPITQTVQVHICGPRFGLPPAEIHSVFPPENGSGDYNNVLPHVVLNRPTLPWERLISSKTNNQAQNDALEQIPFLALLLFTEAEELDGEVTPPHVVSLKTLGYILEPGDKNTDQVTVIDVKQDFLEYLLPTGKELRLLAHGRELIQSPTSEVGTHQSTNSTEGTHQRAVVIASRLPISDQRHVAHLVMLENRYTYNGPSEDWHFESAGDLVRLVCLKSWQFTCAGNKPTLKGRLLNPDFNFDWLCVPKAKTGADAFEHLRLMSYTALPYHLRWGDRAYTLYHGPMVASPSIQAAADTLPAIEPDQMAPASAESLVRLLKNQNIFDVSQAAAWQLGQMLMLRDQNVAMAYFTWRRHDAQLRAREASWEKDSHLHLGDDAHVGLVPMPAVVHDWFQQCLALQNLPFDYLVPDGRMLPENSLRVFSLHRPWMECLIAGALAVGRSSDADRSLEVEYRKTIFATVEQEWSGFLLRSPAVDEHPDLQVEAIIADSLTPEKEVEVNQMRLERIGPGLLLGLYAGQFSNLRFSPPFIGLFFGLQENDNADVFFYSKVLKDQPGRIAPLRVAMKSKPTRVSGGGDVIDVNALSEIMNIRTDDSPMPSGLFAYHMCQGTESVIFNMGGPQINIGTD